MTHVAAGALKVAPILKDFIEAEALPGTGIEAARFWTGLAAIIEKFAPRNRALLDTRDLRHHAIGKCGGGNERDGEGQHGEAPEARASRDGQLQGRASGTMTLSFVDTVKRTSGRSSYAVVSPSFSYEVTSRSVVFPSSTWKV